MRTKKTLPEVAALFWANVEKSGGCWIYRGGKRFIGFNSRPFTPIRFAWLAIRGSEPDGELRHTCENHETCVNPDHAILRRELRLEDRFWDKVVKSDGCWEWQGATYHFGYGAVRVKGKNHHAHRVSWELTHGAIPDGQKVLHRCDNPPCVRPDHLFLGTDADNHADMMQKKRHSPPPVLLAEANPQTKLTVEIVREMRRRYAAGEVSMYRLAKEHSVDLSLASRIIKRTNWKHVE